MQKKKLNLKEVKVVSFITPSNNLKGGYVMNSDGLCDPNSAWPGCSFATGICCQSGTNCDISFCICD